MRVIYNIVILQVKSLLFILKFFNSKIRSFVEERKKVLEILEKTISKTDNYIWIHVASLGEYEQGLPIFKEIKSLYKNHKIVLSFFSSSGYQVRKNNPIGDITIYLPLDTSKNSRKFVSLINPKMVFFVFKPYPYPMEVKGMGIVAMPGTFSTGPPNEALTACSPFSKGTTNCVGAQASRTSSDVKKKSIFFI